LTPRVSATILPRTVITPFDTLKFTKRLEAAGMPADQAEAIVEAFGDAMGAELVTKDFLKAEIEAAKYDLVKWIAGLLLAQAGLVTALVKLL
jgi:hypothetical protein